MTTTIEAIAKILEQEDIGYMFNHEKNFLFVAIALDTIKDQGIVIKVVKDGRIVQITAPLLLQIDNNVHKGIVMQKMLEFQFKTPILKFTCTTLKNNKQYIEARIDFPIYYNTFTEEHLFFCFNFLRAKLIEQLPRLQHLLDKGCEPPKKNSLRANIRADVC